MDATRIYPAQVGTESSGQLEVDVISMTDNSPIADATVTIAEISQPDQILEQITTDSNGQTEQVELAAPPVDYSLSPSVNQPYSEYTVTIEAPGFEPLTISGAQIFASVIGLQRVALLPMAPAIASDSELYVIPPHTLFGDYPPKIAESEIKTVDETGEIVLSRVVIPEFVVVHDGPPTDSSAQNYYVRYRDYIKNVASSEIYSTWPEETIKANIMAIQSFTLNRVYTEWYRNRGYDFTITSSTAFDHKWMPNRTIYDTIDRIVDNIFADYLSRPGVSQPILTQYCDGRRVSCPNWMSQWGSKYLGDEGYAAIDILKYYYGDSIYANYSETISGVPASWPREDLTIGSTGDKVRQMQEQLNRISDTYTAIPKITADGIYGPATADAVRAFQKVFKLPQTGVTDYATWYKISEIYVAVTRIAELY
ncbi:peptidoglycan-binding protein [Anaerolentibacter hominis]|uniref:peptidoglycan-binding protein n=1 Tax=Anaerolentibacter hominis TaxID=3079009 RepID=UPI0031B877A3